MSAPKTTAEDPIKGTGAESPTTVRPLDMDDDDIQESGILSNDAPSSNTAPKPESAEENPPPKPPRPLNPMQQTEATLKEAFPSIDASVIRAVLVASGGNVEPAFNALLGMSDPDALREPPPPAQPPRPTANNPQGSTPMSQLEADEMYARQLAEHYDARSYGNRASGQRGRPQEPAYNPNDEDNRNFFDDDLPVIKENLRKGFLETQSKVNGWITTLKKKIDGDDEGTQGYGSSSQNASYGRRSGDNSRRSGDYNRYDADPQVLGDDFAGMQLNQDAPQRRTTRPLANPDLFKPTPAAPKSEGRKVSFQNNEQDDLYRTSPKLPAAAPAKQSKWQPLSNVAPSPIGDNDNDPFSLGDSEDEKESKDRVGGKEIKMEDTERLKKAAAEAMAGNISEPSQKPEPAEIVGTKDKLADEKLTGGS